MKIVDRSTFLAMPADTVFAKYAPCYFDELCIKGNTIGDNDFACQEIVGALDARDSGEWADLLDQSEKSGTSIPMDFDCMGRDGLFDEDQLFAVFEPTDVQALIARLQQTLQSREDTHHVGQ